MNKTGIALVCLLVAGLAMIPAGQAKSLSAPKVAAAPQQDFSLCVTDFVASQSYDTGDYSAQIGTLDVLNYDAYTLSYGLNTAVNALVFAFCSASYALTMADGST